jgi:hypothetical protein
VYTALQAAMPLKDMATTISAALLLRFLGGTVGISIGEVNINVYCTMNFAQ